MNTGSFFTIGTTHLICEDYALHGDGFAIISDGCSNGGGPRIHTDWGSRLLCKAAKQHLDLLPDDPQAFNNRCISTAMTQVSSIPDLPMECLTATLLVALAKKDMIHVHMVGDGVYGARLKDGNYWYSVVHFGTKDEPHSAPYYLRYDLNKADRLNYLDRFGSKYTQTLYCGKIDEKFNVTQHDIIEDGISHAFPRENVDFVFVASDGVCDFYKPEINGGTKRNKPIPVYDTLNVLLDFKSFQGNFVERQGQWTMKTKRPGSFGKLDWHNGDDVSLGVIYCGDDE